MTKLCPVNMKPCTCSGPRSGGAECGIPGSPKAVPTSTAMRFTGGKRRMDLVPPDAIMALADLMTVNGHKYPDRNWEKGMDYSMVLGSLKRHTAEFEAGVDIDPTDNQHHAIKMMWNAMALYCYWNRGVGNDDRHVVPMPEPRPLPDTAAAKAEQEKAQTYG